MKKLRLLICALAALGALPASAAAPANVRSTGTGMDGQASVFGILGYNYYYANAYGIGVRYQKILAPNVLKANIRDDISLEGGLDVVHSSWDYPWTDGFYWYSATGTYTAVSPVVGLLWNFWLNNKLSLYPKLDLGYEIGSVKWESNDPYWNTYYNTFHTHSYGGAYLDLSGGLAYKTDSVTLRAQVGVHGLYLGLGFRL